VPTAPANHALGCAVGRIEYDITFYSMQDMNTRRSAANILYSRILLNIMFYVFATAFIKFRYRVLSLKFILKIAIVSCSIFFNSHRYIEMELLFMLIYTAAWVIANRRYFSSVRRFLTFSSL
jgi:hypothetical protein